MNQLTGIFYHVLSHAEKINFVLFCLYNESNVVFDQLTSVFHNFLTQKTKEEVLKNISVFCVLFVQRKSVGSTVCCFGPP